MSYLFALDFQNRLWMILRRYRKGFPDFGGQEEIHQIFLSDEFEPKTMF